MESIRIYSIYVYLMMRNDLYLLLVTVWCWRLPRRLVRFTWTKNIQYFPQLYGFVLAITTCQLNPFCLAIEVGLLQSVVHAFTFLWRVFCLVFGQDDIFQCDQVWKFIIRSRFYGSIVFWQQFFITMNSCYRTFFEKWG